MQYVLQLVLRDFTLQSLNTIDNDLIAKGLSLFYVWAEMRCLNTTRVEISALLITQHFAVLMRLSR